MGQALSETFYLDYFIQSLEQNLKSKKKQKQKTKKQHPKTRKPRIAPDPPGLRGPGRWLPGLRAGLSAKGNSQAAGRSLGGEEKGGPGQGGAPALRRGEGIGTPGAREASPQRVPFGLKSKNHKNVLFCGDVLRAALTPRGDPSPPLPAKSGAPFPSPKPRSS